MALKTITIKSGEKAILPSGAKITSVLTEGSVNVEYSCGQLPTPEGYACYEFIYGVDVQDSSRVGDGVKLQELIVGDMTYSLGEAGGGAGDEEQIMNTFNSNAPSSLIKLYDVWQGNGGADYNEMHIRLKMPASIASKTKLRMNMNGFFGLLLEPIAIDCP